MNEVVKNKIVESLCNDIEREYGDFTPTVARLYTEKIELETYLRIQSIIDNVKDSDNIEQTSKLRIIDQVVSLQVANLKDSLGIDDQD